VPSIRKISDFKPLFTNVAQTSHFQVIFGGLPGPLLTHLLLRGIDPLFIAQDAGLLCYSASLPATSLMTSDITNNFTGIDEKIAHRRTFVPITLDFYVDSNYKSLKFMEHWIEFIADGSGAPKSQEGYFFRMQYPKSYKSNRTKIIKFDRDYKKEIEYNFFDLFPVEMSSIPVSYGNSDVLKMSVNFSYLRYVCGKTLSLDIFRNIDNNKKNDIDDNLTERTNEILEPDFGDGGGPVGDSVGDNSGIGGYGDGDSGSGGGGDGGAGGDGGG